MATANEEFSDLMPHRIKVTKYVEDESTPELGDIQYDDYGYPINPEQMPTDPESPAVDESLTYMCLIDDTTSVARNADGEQITVALTAYVAPVPLESTDGEPVDIPNTSRVEILTPYQTVRPVKSIERHYDSEDGVGMLHNIVLRFT
jgi:hypothetical protein